MGKSWETMGFYGICSHILPAEEKKRRTVKAGAKTDRSLEGSGEEITWQKGNRLTDRPGRVSPWNGQSGPPREAGGVCGRTTHGSHLRGCPKGNQKQTIDERGLLPRTSMGKNAIGSTEGKETKRERKVLSNSQVTVTRSKAMQTSPSVDQKVRSSSSWDFDGKIMRNTWDFDGILKGFWWENHEKPMGFWDFEGILMGKSWETMEFYGILKGFWCENHEKLWDFDGILMGRSWETHGILMGFWRDFDVKIMRNHGILWDFEGILMGKSWETMGFWWNFDGFVWCILVISMVILIFWGD